MVQTKVHLIPQELDKLLKHGGEVHRGLGRVIGQHGVGDGERDGGSDGEGVGPLTSTVHERCLLSSFLTWPSLYGGAAAMLVVYFDS